jgi:hypothetical protein
MAFRRRLKVHYRRFTLENYLHAQHNPPSQGSSLFTHAGTGTLPEAGLFNRLRQHPNPGDDNAERVSSPPSYERTYLDQALSDHIPGLGTFILRRDKNSRKRRREFVNLGRSQKAKVVKTAYKVMESICEAFCPGEKLELFDALAGMHNSCRTPGHSRDEPESPFSTPSPVSDSPRALDLLGHRDDVQVPASAMYGPGPVGGAGFPGHSDLRCAPLRQPWDAIGGAQLSRPVTALQDQAPSMSSFSVASTLAELRGQPRADQARPGESAVHILEKMWQAACE